MNDYDWNPDNMDGGDYLEMILDHQDREVEYQIQREEEDYLEWVYQIQATEAEETYYNHLEEQDQLVRDGLKGVVVTLK